MRCAYLLLVCVFAACWAALFLTLPSRRREMLVMSVVITPLSSIEPILARDYFAPEYLLPHLDHLGIEDYLVGFFTGGVGASCSSAVVGVRYKALRHMRRLDAAVFLYAGPLLIYLAATLIFGLSSIWWCVVLMAASGAAQLMIRPDLAAEAAWSAVIVTTIFVVSYVGVMEPLFPGVMRRFWTSDLWLFGVPVQEFLYGTAFGAWSAVTYKLANGEIRQ